jgi:EF hand domain-containing protein
MMLIAEEFAVKFASNQCDLTFDQRILLVEIAGSPNGGGHMARWLAGIAAVLLLVTGAVLAFQRDRDSPALPPAPTPRLASATAVPLSAIPNPPEADPKSKEQRRFERSDKNEDGRISLAELTEPRRKAFAKLDSNSDGRLSFEEWASRTIEKFEGADADKSQWLTAAEFASTAPKTRKKPACSC